MRLAGYIENFEQIEAALPVAERPARRARFQQFLDRGFPDKSSERWHYTDLSALNDRRFDIAADRLSTTSIPSIDGVDRLVFVDGRLDAAQCSTAAASMVAVTTTETDEDRDAVQALNAAFATPGLNLRIAARQTLPRPLHVVIAHAGGDAPSMSHQRHRIVLETQAEATVFFELIGDESGERLSTQQLDIELAAGAQLRLVRIQRERGGSTLLARTTARLDRDAVLHAVMVDAGTGLARHDVEIVLSAPGAAATLHALCMPTARAHCDTQMRIVHAAPQGRSRLHFRGIVDDRARAIFNGHVIVKPGAQKTDSEQRIASLLLSPRAEINAKPDLEIHADDVKCAHGATVGQLDDAALGYLRSRGVDAATARALLLRAFAVEAIAPIAFLPLRHHVESLLGFPLEDAVAAEAA